MSIRLVCGDGFDGDLFADAFFEGDDGFGADHTGDALDFVAEDIAQVAGIAAHDLGEDAVAAGGVIGLHDLGDGVELTDHLVVHRSLYQVYADERHQVVPQAGGVENKGGAFDHTHGLEFFHAHVYGSG